ncbi:PREDICTED: protein FAM208B-like [Tinamus guttatus]|uniref:protein FAM208B-like n=1 Tax=Tinamus guttatus TaxID=94827 RepID=UPI00052ECF2C|nr:PREDICTED: protein FAM208B-like [Tinamus guttatus]
MTHVMGLSDLKKKIPEAAFGKSNYVGNEVCFQGIYFSLYEVEISNKEQHKMDELLQNLKEKDLAIVKYLQDRGVLILLPSAALTRDDALEPEEPVGLLALFLFTSSRALCPTAAFGLLEPSPMCEGQDDTVRSLRPAPMPWPNPTAEPALKNK